MSFETAILLLVILTSLFLLIVELFTVLFRVTGLSEEVSRFQVISMLTNSGYTTRESEVIVRSPRRRKLAFYTMLFGYLFSVAMVSLLVNAILTFYNKGIVNWAVVVLPPLALVGVLLLLRYSPFIRKRLSNTIASWGTRLMFGTRQNRLVILDVRDNGVIAELRVDSVPEVLAGKTLKDAQLASRHHVQIMHIEREGNPGQHVHADTMIQQGDFVLLFGKQEAIVKLFKVKSV